MQQPGGARPSRTARTTLRVLGVALVVAGALTFFWGIGNLWSEMNDYGDPQATHIVAFLGGFLVAGIGLQCLVLGFAGAVARYGVAEAAPALREGLEYLRDGDAEALDCRSCGTRNDLDASYCDSCGTRLA